MSSIWIQTTQISGGTKDTLPASADVVVIGAGITGLLTAFCLQREGREVAVIEAGRIASGQTQNTTAKITSQHGLIYTTLIHQYGLDAARRYAMANEEAIASYAKLVREENISCHFEPQNAYLYSVYNSQILLRECEAAAALGIKAHFSAKTSLPFETMGAVCFENQAQFHPLEFARHLSGNLKIYENTCALRVKGNRVVTTKGTIEGKNIVFASHYPFQDFPGMYFVRQHQERSYVIAITGIPKWEGMYYSADKEGLSFRWYEDVLLVGGGGHRTGSQTGLSGYGVLEKKVGKLFPRYREVARWSAQDCVTHDDLPFIGRFSVFHSNWYVATGLKKWGMTGAMISARLICDQICGRNNPYESVFTPWRFHGRASWEKIGEDVRFSITGLSKGYFHLPLQEESLPKAGEAKIMRIGLRRYGVYCDVEGNFHKVPVKCRHLGCELTWNPCEHTWDCPCHGSRYDCDGGLLDNPAQTSLKNNVL